MPDARVDGPIDYDAIDYDADVTRPDFAVIDPAMGSTNVPVTTPVSVTFTEPVLNVDTTSFYAMFSITNLPGAVTSSDNITWTFTPTNDWPAASVISMTLTSAITDFSGNHFITFGWTFTTQ